MPKNVPIVIHQFSYAHKKYYSNKPNGNKCQMPIINMILN